MKDTQNPVLDCPVQRTLIKITENYTYGDMIKHSWLYEHLEIEFPQFGEKHEFEAPMFKYMSYLQALQDMLLREHQMYLMNSKGYGYRIVKPGEQADVAMSRFREKIRKETNKAMEALTYINTKLLTDDQIKRKDEAIGKVAALSAFSAKKIGHSIV